MAAVAITSNRHMPRPEADSFLAVTTGRSPEGQPVQGVLDIAPEEDAGAETADRFEFQHHVVALYCLDLVRPGTGLRAVICEWHTDFLLIRQDGSAALVSVKHREPSRGPWTISRLIGDGELLVLMDRWLSLAQPGECRFVTNAGLDPDCRRLAQACASSDEEEIERHADGLAARVSRSTDDLTAFLRALRFQADLPSRRHVRAVHVERHARPLCEALRRDVRAAADCYDGVVDLARIAARAASESPDAVTAEVSAAGRLDASILRRDDVARRTLTIDMVRVLFERAGLASVAPPAATSARATRLTVKLREGALGETVVHSAIRSRIAWTAHERAVSAPVPDPTHDETAALRVRVLHEAAMSETAARLAAGSDSGGTAPAPYGAPMLTILEERLAAVAGSGPSPGVGPDLLLGLAFDLTAECEIWWSPQFDVDARIASITAAPESS